MVQSEDSPETVQIAVQDVLLRGVLPANTFADCSSYDDQVKAVLKSQTASIERKYQVDWEQSFYTSMICAGSCATEINAASHADRLSDFCAKHKGAHHTDEEYAAWDGVLKTLYMRFHQSLFDESLGDYRGTADIPSDLYNSPRRDNWNNLVGRWASVEDTRTYAAVAGVPPLRMSLLDSQAIHQYGHLGHQVLNAVRFQSCT
ncbi:hypothetical protein LTR97_002374 [Elasticomyces elasticus]|uniref:Uncharacterized protein n=1 Tax=Elasticomyces elasticus TaxID=574655 RepID=A0AAN7VW52_9PEZI|nr:hypothetical protein LTR97_002374 [Elasticomyces elasticus]